jgi:hypothetical protein
MLDLIKVYSGDFAGEPAHGMGSVRSRAFA